MSIQSFICDFHEIKEVHQINIDDFNYINGYVVIKKSEWYEKLLKIIKHRKAINIICSLVNIKHEDTEEYKILTRIFNGLCFSDCVSVPLDLMEKLSINEIKYEEVSICRQCKMEIKIGNRNVCSVCRYKNKQKMNISNIYNYEDENRKKIMKLYMGAKNKEYSGFVFPFAYIVSDNRINFYLPCGSGIPKRLYEKEGIFDGEFSGHFIDIRNKNETTALKMEQVYEKYRKEYYANTPKEMIKDKQDKYYDKGEFMPVLDKSTGKWKIGDKTYSNKAAADRAWAAYQAKKKGKK